MCIIAYSPYGEKLTNSVLKNCFLAHSDGAGIMFRTMDNKIIYRKGLMTITSLKREYKKMYSMFPYLEHAIHFRTGTSGVDELGCTHPFPLSDCYFELHMLSGIADRMMMHNGILGHGENGLSDTQVYVKDILHPMKNILHQQSIQDLIEDHIGSYNKFLIFDRKESYMLGEWVEDGMFFYTNNDYMPNINCTSWKYYIDVKKQMNDMYWDDFNEDSYLKRWEHIL